MGKVEILADMSNPPKIESSPAAGHLAKVSNLSAAQEHGIPRKEVSLEMAHFHNDEDVEFHISSQREILSILQGIADQGSRVCMYYYYGSNPRFIMTTLLGVNEHGIWLDVGPFPQQNKQLLLVDEITFVSVHRQVKIQFVARDIVNGLFKGNPALYIELPHRLLRIQRREFFRAAIPSTDPVTCLIPVQPEKPGDQVILRLASLVDISCGGIRLLCEEQEPTLLPNKTIPDCEISLPDDGTLTVTIEVRNSTNFTTPDNVAHTRAGCRFIGMNNQMNIMLQRHITRLQGASMARRHLAVPC